MLKRLPTVTFNPWTSRLFNLLMRFIPPAKLPADVLVEVVEVGRLFRPRQPSTTRRAALLWVHGGGRVVGRAMQDDQTCARLVQALGIPVLSVEYRLAPEHPFPAALQDCEAAWRWLCEARERLGVDHILLAGESAGGGLAAELAQSILDQGGLQPLAQILIYPMLDDRTALDTGVEPRAHFVWHNDSNRFAWSAYLGERFGAASLPPYAAAARREDLTGLPAAWIMVGELDLFYGECVAYHERLRACGVSSQLYEVPGGFHGMFQMGRDEAPVVAFW